MKRKSILTIAALCAVALQSASPAAFAAETARTVPADACAVLTEANGGVLPRIAYTETGAASEIDGIISARKIRSESDAAAVLKGMSGLLGIADFDSELIFDSRTESTYNDVYTFRQVYQGLTVRNAYVKLVVDQSSRQANFLTSSFAPGLTLDTAPEIPADAAKTILQEQLDAEVSGTPELVVFRTEDGKPHLAWHGVTDRIDASIVYLDAETGTVLHQVGPAYALPQSVEQMTSTSDGKYNPIVHSNRFMLTYAKQGDDYYSYDSKRNIYITRDDYNPEYALRDYYFARHEQYFFEKSVSGMAYNFQNTLGLSNLCAGTYHVSSKSKMMDDKLEAGTMYVVQRIYDFYLNNFGWKGTDGKGSALAVRARYQSSQGSFASPCGNYIAYAIFNSGDSEHKEAAACAWDVAAHEFTHRVTIAKVKWEDQNNNNTETDALQEAYSDIMGEYFENKLQWKFAEDEYKQSGRCSRDLTCSPSSGRQRNPYDGNLFYYHYNAYRYDKQNLGAYEHIEQHSASTIISHAAYLMHHAGLPAAIGREIWYTSLDYLSQGANAANFIQCRTAVLKAADAVLSRKSLSASDRTKYKNYVVNAFNTVGIPDVSNKMGDVNGDGLVDNKDVDAVTQAARGYTPKNFNKKTADVNYDGRVTMQDADAISRAIRNHTTQYL